MCTMVRIVETMKKWKRKPELPFYGRHEWIAEYWNSLSNIPFIVIGLLRWQVIALDDGPGSYEKNIVAVLYLLYTLAGVCSLIHHAIRWRWSIVIDWIPIAASIGYILVHRDVLFHHMHFIISVLDIAFALFILIVDHVRTIIPVPWGHVMWHIVAAFVLDSVYQTMYYEIRISFQCTHISFLDMHPLLKTDIVHSCTCHHRRRFE